MRTYVFSKTTLVLPSDGTDARSTTNARREFSASTGDETPISVCDVKDAVPVRGEDFWMPVCFGYLAGENLDYYGLAEGRTCPESG